MTIHTKGKRKKNNKTTKDHPVSYDAVLAPYRAKLCQYTSVIEKITNELKLQKIRAELALGGSVAKGTFLKPYDVDIFVRFKGAVNTKALGNILPSLFPKVTVLHGSRDYFQFTFEGHRYEIVPVLHIEKAQDAENTTDVSYFHVQWIKEHLVHPDDARLAKLFAHAQGVYGAESYVNGFSGYVLEVLAVYYGSFDALIAAAAQWKPQTILDPAHHYKSEKEVLFALNSSKTRSPLIIVDPVQKERNAAAALSLEMFARFVTACKTYVAYPHASFFVKKKFSFTELKQRAKRYDFTLTVIHFGLLSEKMDIAMTKALAAYQYMKKQIELNDFVLADASYDPDNNIFWFLSSPHELTQYKKRLGPEIWAPEQRLTEFRERHPEAYLEGDRMVAFVSRKYLSVAALVKDLVKKDEVKKRIARIKIK